LYVQVIKTQLEVRKENDGEAEAEEGDLGW
jgi:hypothetical protein